MYVFNMVVDVIISALMLIQFSLSLPLDSIVFGIDAKASVFETGDEMYTVMWSTTRPGTGYVTYTFEGTEYVVNDSQNGSIRSTEKIHSVRIPKEHLDHNTYTYHSQQVGVKRAYTAIKGRTVSSAPVEFGGYDGQDRINALVISDIHDNHFPVDKAVKNFEEKPDLLIINGDAVSLMTSSLKFTQVLWYAYRYSEGKIPVAYVKGNHENRGEYSAEMVNCFRTSTGGLYYTFSYGPVSFIALDSGEDKADSDWTYSGLADFSSYIAEETKWLRSLAPDRNAACRVALSHMPYLSNRYGNDWIGILGDLDTDIAVYAHKHRLNLHYEEGRAPFFQMLDGGKTNDNGFVATMLTFCGSSITSKSYDDNGKMCGEYTFVLDR